MSFTTLKSRIPEIATALPIKVGAAIHAGTEQIASAASTRAPVATAEELRGDAAPGDLKQSIEARAGRSRTEGEAYGIWAAWYYLFTEFGTTRQTAEPYMIPAAEAGKDNLAVEVAVALKTL